MSDFTLVIGNKNYSSWSLRPWLLLRHLQLPFAELQIPLTQPDTRARLLEQSPAGRVPVLKHGALTIWESLAIMEYLCEIADAGLPRDRTARAHARAVSAEMHAGFGALRAQWPFNARATGRRTPMTPELRAEIERVQALWADCRTRFGDSGPWLFGDYSLADAMFAPVVLRFRSYGATLSPQAQAYVATTLQDAPLLSWLAAATAERWRIDYCEIGEVR
ncbi:MAG TPA: glutathione S-transferase family protein [Steroidobacteraceae bacterium]|jgi:glutathione S-transferase